MRIVCVKILLLITLPGFVCAAPATLRTPRMQVEVQNGVITRFVNRLIGETFAVKNLPPLTGIRHRQSGDLWNDRARVEQAATAQEVATTLRWREPPGTHVLRTRLRALPNGEALVTQHASCVTPGLLGLQWGIVIPDELELLVPGYSGLRFSRESDYQPMQFDYPMTWEAQFVLIQGKRGGLLIHAEDNAQRFKRLFVQHRNGQFWIGFETWCTAPFEKVQQAESVRWRIRPYRGNWLNGVAMYRRWAENAFGLASLRKKQPAWVQDIQTVVIDNLDDMDKMQALAKRLNPRQTLLYVPDWRKHGYDRNYPDYTPREGFAEQMAQARRLGFRIMLHVNYFGCTPENPDYEQLKRYHFRDPFSGQPMYWDWQRAHPPIKFAYINPAAKAWRRLFVQRMVELYRQLKPDALHLDQTLCIYNDANGLIDGMNSMQGNIALHRELREALPDVALSGEGLNEISFRYESFAQRHVWGIDHADARWEMSRVRMAHPVSSALLTPHTRIYGYLGMTNPQMWQHYAAWRTAYDRMGVIPTFAWLTRQQVSQPDATIQMLWNEARWFQAHRPLPEFAPSLWEADTLFLYRTASGHLARYRQEKSGVCLETQEDNSWVTLFRRIEGVTRAQVSGSIPGWLAYNGREIMGLNPASIYPWQPEPPSMDRVHLHALPETVTVSAAGVQEGEWARFAFEPCEMVVAELRKQRGNVVHAVAEANRTGTPEPDYLVEHAPTGAVARPYGDGIFMHPPWRTMAGGRVWLEFTLTLPADRPCEFRSGLGFTSPEAAEKSDGVTFTVTAFGQSTTVSATRYVPGKMPEQISLDLSRFRGQRVRLRLEVRPGPNASPDFDWGYWSHPRVVVKQTQDAPVEVYSPQPFRWAYIDGRRVEWQAVASNRYRFSLPSAPSTLVLLYADAAPLALPADLTEVRFYTNIELDGTTQEPVDYLRGSVDTGVCNGVSKQGFSAHPPPNGKTFLAFLLRLPQQGASLRGFAGIRDGAESRSNGVRFSVEVNGKQVWNRTVNPGEGWIPFEVSLAVDRANGAAVLGHRFAGQLRLGLGAVGGGQDRVNCARAQFVQRKEGRCESRTSMGSTLRVHPI
ncbi:MAG: DUF6259 domain-containing protein [Armatimonadota bacterium]